MSGGPSQATGVFSQLSSGAATEYRSGLIRVTLAATPRRGRVLAAKAVVIAGTAAVLAVVRRQPKFPSQISAWQDGGDW